MRPSLQESAFRPAILALAAGTIMAGLVAGAPPATAAEPDNWIEVKCARYTKAWEQGLARMGTEGLSAAFLARHAAFIASGCTAKADVCARSDREIALANAMIVMAMNAGMASTFPPFYCRD